MAPTPTNPTKKAKTLARLKSLLSATSSTLSCGGCGSRRLKLPDVHHPIPRPDEPDPPPPPNQSSRLAEALAVVKDSDDPYVDFKHSMLHMVFEKDIFDKPDLQELLACFLRLNSPCHHDAIIRAFSEIWKALMSPPPELADPNCSTKFPKEE